ncbi:MAG: holo-ACP synthase [Fimbriimonadaceae bacterium]
MIKGLGTDIVSIQRIAEAMKNERFVERVLAAAERAEPVSPAKLAGRWAAKEALAKAVSTNIGWHEVEVHNDAEGCPHLVLNRPELVSSGDRLHLSISHEQEYAVATVIWEGA